MEECRGGVDDGEGDGFDDFLCSNPRQQQLCTVSRYVSLCCKYLILCNIFITPPLDLLTTLPSAVLIKIPCAHVICGFGYVFCGRCVSVPLSVLWSCCPKVSELSGSIDNLQHLLMDEPQVKLSQDGSGVLVNVREQGIRLCFFYKI